MKRGELAILAVFAALYPAIVCSLQSISFGIIQVRVADALYPLIAVFGRGALIGLIIGHAIANLSSPFGLLDLLSVVVCIPAKIAIYKFGFKAVPLHIASVALWVGYILSFYLRVPFYLAVVHVAIGESVAELVLGGWLYASLRRLRYG